MEEPSTKESFGRGTSADAAREVRSAIVETTHRLLQYANIALHDGRLLSDTDGAESPQVAVISESLARRYFPARIRWAAISRPAKRKPKVNG